jgi:hypothetical protein
MKFLPSLQYFSPNKALIKVLLPALNSPTITSINKSSILARVSDIKSKSSVVALHNFNAACNFPNTILSSETIER